MVKQLDQFLRYFLNPCVRVFVSYVFSRRSAKTPSVLNIMLSVVSLVNGCWKGPDIENCRLEHRRKRTWIGYNMHVKQLPLLDNDCSSIFRSSVWWHFIISVIWAIIDLTQKKTFLGWQSILISSSVSARSRRWMGFNLLFTHQSIFILLSLNYACSTRIVIKCSNKDGFYVWFCSRYSKMLFNHGQHWMLYFLTRRIYHFIESLNSLGWKLS